MFKSDYFFLIIVSFLFGILVEGFFENADFAKMLGVMVFLFVFVLRFLKKNEVSQEREIFKIFVVLAIAVLIGFLRFYLLNQDYYLNLSEGGEVEFEGCVVAEPDDRGDKVKYVLEVVEFGRVLVTFEKYPFYEYGQCLKVSGELMVPEEIEGFDYKNYLLISDISYVMYYPLVEEVSEQKGNLFFQYLYAFKSLFKGKLEVIFAEPYSSFMDGLILGSRRGISGELMGNFNITGLTHIIAISGYNVALVISAIGMLLTFLSFRLKIFISIFFVIVFVLLVGASSSVVRAGVMGVISLLAVVFGRQYFAFLGLFISAFIMCFWNPRLLFFDVSFQLSFLATLGILIFSSRIKDFFSFLPSFFLIKESLVMTLSAQIFVLPIIILNFGRLSLISPVANLFVLPLIPLAMISGFFAVVVSWFSLGLASLIGFFGFVVLKTVIFFVEFFASFPFASVEISELNFWLCFSYYFWMMKSVIDNYN